MSDSILTENRSDERVTFIKTPLFATPEWSTGILEWGQRTRDNAAEAHYTSKETYVAGTTSDGDECAAGLSLIKEIALTGENIEVHAPRISVFVDEGTQLTPPQAREYARLLVEHADILDAGAN